MRVLHFRHEHEEDEVAGEGGDGVENGTKSGVETGGSSDSDGSSLSRVDTRGNHSCYED